MTMRVLFICNYNINRSRTAEEVFARKHETRSAGFYGGNMLRRAHIEWADAIVVMDERMQEELLERFPEAATKHIINFDVPNRYFYRQQELIELLRGKEHLLGES